MVLASLINHPERLNRDTLYELRSIVARYPYFQTARLLMLNNMYLLHEPDFGTELRRSVLYVYDRRALCRLIEGNFDRVESEVLPAKEEPTVDRTMSLIDAFLDTLSEEPVDTLQFSMDVVGDYVAQFLADNNTDVTSDLHSDVVLQPVPSNDSGVFETSERSEFSQIPQVLSEIANADEEVAVESSLGNEDSEDQELPDEGCFTETLAKIYIKQHKYSRALEIIRGLYLKYPEKNIYFADQIRFLEKLIINNNSK